MLPDVVLIYLGVNDFGNGVPVRRDGRKEHFRGKNATAFAEAYTTMVSGIRRLCGAEVICATLLRTRLRGFEEWEFPEDYAGVAMEEYNRAIRKSCASAGGELADLAATGLQYETLDGFHPTAKGHRTLAEAWIRCLKK